jgi:ankyrin repeat protein
MNPLENAVMCVAMMVGLAHGAPRPQGGLSALAVEGRVEEIAKQLGTGADPNAFEDHGFTPLGWAARYGQTGAMRVLFDGGAKLDLPDRGPNGWTPIMHALHKGQTKTALALLEWEADANAKAPNGVTPLMRAACEKNPEVVRALLEHGADPHAETLDHVNVLTYAVEGGDPEIVKMLFAKAPDLRWNDNFEGFVAKMSARLRGQDEVLALIRQAQRPD